MKFIRQYFPPLSITFLQDWFGAEQSAVPADKISFNLKTARSTSSKDAASSLSYQKIYKLHKTEKGKS